MQLTGVIPATRKALERAGMTIDDIDWIEINEAFATVVLAWANELKPTWNEVNPWGGAIAHGHPLGATGAGLMAKMLAGLEATGGTTGLQVMCIGHGMATARSSNGFRNSDQTAGDCPNFASLRAKWDCPSLPGRRFHDVQLQKGSPAMQIHDRAFLVTGGGSGLGAACVRRLAARGGRLIIADVQKQAGAALAAELGASTGLSRPT